MYGQHAKLAAALTRIGAVTAARVAAIVGRRE
jgi:hypothetical protein